METGSSLEQATYHTTLNQILSTLKSIQSDYRQVSAAVEAIDGRVNILTSSKLHYDAEEDKQQSINGTVALESPVQDIHNESAESSAKVSPRPLVINRGPDLSQPRKATPGGRISSSTSSSRIILTTYPGQSGIDPLVMKWGHKDPLQRGPVVVSRSQSTIRRRNGRGTGNCI